MENFSGWFEVLGMIFGALSLGATLTPTKKDDKVFTKAEQIGSALNVVGFDFKALFGLFSKKK